MNLASATQGLVKKQKFDAEISRLLEDGNKVEQEAPLPEPVARQIIRSMEYEMALLKSQHGRDEAEIAELKKNNCSQK
jgi:hypothetical protein